MGLLETDIERLDRITGALHELLHGRFPEPLELPPEPDDEIRQVGQFLNRLIEEWQTFNQDLEGLGRGETSNPIQSKLPAAYTLAHLQSGLRHLTWQAQQVAAGDFDQRVDFLGDFSTHFNDMTRQLSVHRREADKRAFERGLADMAAGVMHNVGNTINGMQSVLYESKNRVEALPLANLERAIHEYEDPNTSESRRTALLSFIVAATKRVIASISDVAGACNSVSQTITDLGGMISAHNDHPDLEVNYDSCSVREVLHAVVNADGRLDHDGCCIEVDQSIETLPRVRTDRLLLSQVLSNLLSNAREAIAQNNGSTGKIVIRGSVRHGQLVLEVEDNGVGIEEGRAGRVFERGFTTKQKKNGHGLGLHWCAVVLRTMKGRIEASSEGVGKGATLRIELPLTGHRQEIRR
jgi:signal transduction histidine kinase